MILQLLHALAFEVAPAVDKVRDRIHEKELRLQSYFDHFIKSLLDFIPQFFLALIVLVAGLWLVRRIVRLTEKAMTKRDFEISLKTFLRSLLSIGLRVILIVTVIGMLGIGTSSIVTMLGAMGLAIGLALQGSLSNFAGGVLILTFKPFKVGDNIEAGGQIGEVREIQIFNTILLTPEHRTVILPNGPLSNGTIVNISRHGDLRADIQLTVSADNDLQKVTAIIHEVLASNTEILTEPKPKVLIAKITEGIVTINVMPFCITKQAGLLRSELNLQVRDRFEREGIRQGVQERRILNINAKS
jgi:small conductance mechanosensitive channel